MSTTYTGSQLFFLIKQGWNKKQLMFIALNHCTTLLHYANCKYTIYSFIFCRLLNICLQRQICANFVSLLLLGLFHFLQVLKRSSINIWPYSNFIQKLVMCQLRKHQVYYPWDINLITHNSLLSSLCQKRLSIFCRTLYYCKPSAQMIMRLLYCQITYS